MDNELKIMQRGSYYLTPFLEDHIYEFVHVIHPENIRELKILGYSNVAEALQEMATRSEAYLVRDPNGDIIFVGGLDFGGEEPQMFALFSTKLSDNFTALARGSKMLLSFFDQTYPLLTMSILTRYEAMINWAAWLGFEPIGISTYQEYDFVEFVRCNPLKKHVSHETSRPVTH